MDVPADLNVAFDGLLQLEQDAEPAVLVYFPSSHMMHPKLFDT